MLAAVFPLVHQLPEAMGRLTKSYNSWAILLSFNHQRFTNTTRFMGEENHLKTSKAKGMEMVQNPATKAQHFTHDVVQFF